MCGSFCTHEKVLAELEKLVQLYETVIPIASEISAFTDTRFGTSDDLMERLEDLTGHEVLCDIPSVEPIASRKPSSMALQEFTRTMVLPNAPLSLMSCSISFSCVVSWR